MKLKNLKTSFLGINNAYFEKIDSTQNEIWRKIDNEIPNGFLVMAGVQTNGKGTHGKTWYTEKDNNIAFSFYVETGCDVKKLEGLTTQIAEILVFVFEKLYNIKLDIKLPNDIVYKGKKIGGILTEGKIYKEKVRFLVIGIGINTSQTEFNKNIINVATSIKKEFGIDVNIEDVITEFCNIFEEKIIERIK